MAGERRLALRVVFAYIGSRLLASPFFPCGKQVASRSSVRIARARENAAGWEGQLIPFSATGSPVSKRPETVRRCPHRRFSGRHESTPVRAQAALRSGRRHDATIIRGNALTNGREKGSKDAKKELTRPSARLERNCRYLDAGGVSMAPKQRPTSRLTSTPGKAAPMVLVFRQP